MSAEDDPEQRHARPDPAPFFRRVIAGLLFIAVAAGTYAATLLF